MKNMMNYKEYYGSVEYSDEDACFCGKIMGINDLILYEGTSVAELKQAFQGAVDDYLEMCVRNRKVPEKTYKGSFNVRITPELHKRAVLSAESEHLTLNAFVEQAIKKSVFLDV